MNAEVSSGAVEPPSRPEPAAVGPPWRRRLRGLRRIVYWGLPPLILWIVLRRIDLDRVLELASRADRAALLAGIALGPVVVTVGALRWHLLAQAGTSGAPGLFWSLGNYWRSLAVGVLAPGSLGMDAYRVVSLGRRTGDYLLPAAMVLVEKLLALLACAVLVSLLLPMLGMGTAPSLLRPLWIAAVSAVVAAVVVGAVALGMPGLEPFGRLAVALRQRVKRAVDRLARAGGRGTPGVRPERLSGIPARRGVLLQALLLSLVVYLVSAVQAHVFFVALGEPPRLLVNLLVTPLLFAILALPVSFGGLGVRDVAFIVLYGAFGVPAEAAWVVGSCGLAGLLLSIGVGAVLLWWRPLEPGAPRP